MQQKLYCVYVFVLVIASIGSSQRKAERKNDTLELSKKGLQTFRAKDYHNVSEISLLDLSYNEIAEIEDFTFENFTQLKELNLESNVLKKLAVNAFHGLSSLKHLAALQLITEFFPKAVAPFLEILEQERLTLQTSNSFILKCQLFLKNNKLEILPAGVFDPLTSLSVLNLDKNKLQEIPQFGVISTVALLSMKSNPVKRLEATSLKKYKDLALLYLSETEIKYLKDDVFKYNSELRDLHLTGPSLLNIQENAFRGPKYLIELNLERTSIASLPQIGLEWINKINLKDVKNLWQIPVRLFRNLEYAKLTYPFHCCLLQNVRYDEKTFNGNSKPCDKPSSPPNHVLTSTVSTTSTVSPDIFSILKNSLNKKASQNHSLNRNVSSVVFTLPNLVCPTNPPEFMTKRAKSKIKCDPQPDAFNPCENIMGGETLRVCVWIVVVFAITGNLFKLLVILTNGKKLTIPKVVMSSLGFANLCMGIYLAMLAVEDLVTLGVYQNYVRIWQYGPGCKVAGFLSIFSTELAAYTLTVITVERYYTIVYALKQERHLTLKQINILMIIGWLFAIAVALLPLLPFGISSYSKVAICLPFEVLSDVSKVYVTLFLVTNGLAFFAVLFCYSRMYCSLGGVSCSAATRVESRVARRMALLVFVNFACWFPIALFALIAIYGKALIEVETSKFLLVFIYPINSLTNPYLYALSTKSFRVDAFNLLGRCRICRRKMIMMSNELREEIEGLPTLSSRVFAGSKSSLNSYRVVGLTPMETPKTGATRTAPSIKQKEKKSFRKLTDWSKSPFDCIWKPTKRFQKHLEINKEKTGKTDSLVRTSKCTRHSLPEEDSNSFENSNNNTHAKQTRINSIILEGSPASNENLNYRLGKCKHFRQRCPSNESFSAKDNITNGIQSVQPSGDTTKELVTDSQNTKGKYTVVMLSSC